MMFSIILVAVAHYILGALWYSPLMFSNLWMKAKGFTATSMNTPDMKHAMIIGFTGSFIISIVQSAVLAFLITNFSIASASEAALFGAIVSFTFCVLHEVSGALWGECNWPLLLINAGHDFVGTIFAAGLLGYLLN